MRTKPARALTERDAAARRSPSVQIRSVNNVPLELRLMIRTIARRKRTDPKTGIMETTNTLYFYGRKLRPLRFATYSQPAEVSRKKFPVIR